MNRGRIEDAIPGYLFGVYSEGGVGSKLPAPGGELIAALARETSSIGSPGAPLTTRFAARRGDNTSGQVESPRLG